MHSLDACLNVKSDCLQVLKMNCLCNFFINQFNAVSVSMSYNK